MWSGFWRGTRRLSGRWCGGISELQRFQSVRRIITAGQLAKLVIAMPRIEQRIRRLIRRAQQRRGLGGGPSPNLVGP